MLGAGELAIFWSAARRDQDVLSSELLVTNFDNTIGNEGCSSLDVTDVGAFDIALVDAIQALNVGITLSLEGSKVEPEALLSAHSVAFHDMGLLEEVCQVVHDLLWHTADVDAGATDNSVLYHAD